MATRDDVARMMYCASVAWNDDVLTSLDYAGIASSVQTVAGGGGSWDRHPVLPATF